MDFHLPKPLKGWRELIGEVGIIVIGVLIALAAEQAVEAVQWSKRVREAETSMRRELGDDDGAQAYARLAISPCIDAQLESLEEAILAERDGVAPLALPTLGTPAFRTWDSDAWRAAVSSGATSHMTTARMYDWSSPYAITGDMDQAAVREFNDWAELARIKVVRPHPSETERERILAAVARARQDNAFLTLTANNLLRYSQFVGVGVPDKARRVETDRERRDLPGCQGPVRYPPLTDVRR